LPAPNQVRDRAQLNRAVQVHFTENCFSSFWEVAVQFHLNNMGLKTPGLLKRLHWSQALL